jgi:hypothetical protein
MSGAEGDPWALADPEFQFQAQTRSMTPGYRFCEKFSSSFWRDQVAKRRTAKNVPEQAGFVDIKVIEKTIDCGTYTFAFLLSVPFSVDLDVVTGYGGGRLGICSAGQGSIIRKEICAGRSHSSDIVDVKVIVYHGCGQGMDIWIAFDGVRSGCEARWGSGLQSLRQASRIPFLAFAFLSA